MIYDTNKAVVNIIYHSTMQLISSIACIKNLYCYHKLALSKVILIILK